MPIMLWLWWGHPLVQFCSGGILFVFHTGQSCGCSPSLLAPLWITSQRLQRDWQTRGLLPSLLTSMSDLEWSNLNLDHMWTLKAHSRCKSDIRSWAVVGIALPCLLKCSASLQGWPRLSRFLESPYISGIFSSKMWRCSCDRTSWWSIRVSVSQVIEKHYGRSLEVWTERAAVLSENGTDEGEFPEAGDHPSVIMYWSLSVSIFSIGGMLSSFLVGFVGDLRGRWARRDKIMRTYLCEDESLTEE